jgi:glycosyltransferase involved in cell wall biosynthesis
MRIFQILEFNQFNTGSVHQMFQAATGLRERGHDVTIVSRPDPKLQSRAQVHRVAFVGLPLRNQFDVASVRDLRRLIRERKPDVIHVHKGVAHSLALAATYLQPVPAFVVNRGVSFPLDRWNRLKYRTRRVDRVVTVCEQIRGVVIKSGKLRSDKVTVVYAGTDVDVFDPARIDRESFRSEKQIPSDRFLVAQVGVRDWKGWKDLVEAVKEVPGAHLALIGCRNDKETAEVRAFAEARGIGDRFTPVEYRDDMPNVLGSADLVVDASWAGTGITGTIREGMAMEKPVIATDCGGNSELVSSAEVGWLVPRRDQTALVSAIRTVIGDRNRATEIARRARRHVIRGFSKEIRISRLERLYSEIITFKRAR